MANTWGSYGSGKRPGFRSEVADTILRNFPGFVLACSLFVVILIYFPGVCERVLRVNFGSFRLFNFFQVHFSW